jgi:hypothetical protein
MEPNKFFFFNYENVHLSVSYFFQNSMGPRKSKCDILNGTTQGQDCPHTNIFLVVNWRYIILILICIDLNIKYVSMLLKFGSCANSRVEFQFGF